MQIFTNTDHQELAVVSSYNEVAEIALRQLADLDSFDDRPIGMVCGPISTGGLGDIEKNLTHFNSTIMRLMSRGHLLFNQMPYEDVLHRIRDSRVDPGEYDMGILEDFYGPLFDSGYIQWQAFMYDWRSSRGSRWEFRQARSRGLRPLFLCPEGNIKNKPFGQ